MTTEVLLGLVVAELVGVLLLLVMIARYAFLVLWSVKAMTQDVVFVRSLLVEMRFLVKKCLDAQSKAAVEPTTQGAYTDGHGWHHQKVRE